MPDMTQVAASVDALVPAPLSESDHQLAAEFVRKHAGGDAGELLAALGLEAGE